MVSASTDAQGNKVETDAPYIDSQGYTVIRTVTFLKPINYSDILLFPGTWVLTGIWFAIFLMILFGLKLLFGKGGYYGNIFYVIVLLIIAFSSIYNIFVLDLTKKSIETKRIKGLEPAEYVVIDNEPVIYLTFEFFAGCLAAVAIPIMMQYRAMYGGGTVINAGSVSSNSRQLGGRWR